MSKQDRQGVRKATDLEQKYNFGKSFAEVMGLARDAQDAANAAKDAADKLDNNLTSDEIFNRLTENGALQGLYKEDGNLYINASYIKSGQISTVYSKVYLAADYTENDITVMRGIMMGTATATAEQMARYDINGDGVITSSEVIYVRNMMQSGKNVTVSWKCLLNPSNSKEMFKVWREIEKPDSSGNVTVTETVMLYAGVGTGVAPAVEDISYSGCYYRVVNGVQEWINPPMVLGTEYRTTERWNGKVLYTKLVDCGAFPSTTAVGVTNIQVKSIEAVAVSGDTTLKIPSANVSVSASSNIIISTTDSTLTAYNAYVTLKYTKD